MNIFEQKVINTRVFAVIFLALFGLVPGVMAQVSDLKGAELAPNGFLLVELQTNSVLRKSLLSDYDRKEYHLSLVRAFADPSIEKRPSVDLYSPNHNPDSNHVVNIVFDPEISVVDLNQLFILIEEVAAERGAIPSLAYQSATPTLSRFIGSGDELRKSPSGYIYEIRSSDVWVGFDGGNFMTLYTLARNLQIAKQVLLKLPKGSDSTKRPALNPQNPWEQLGGRKLVGGHNYVPCESAI